MQGFENLFLAHSETDQIKVALIADSLKTVCFETRVTFAKQGGVCHLCSRAFRNLKPDGAIFVIKYSEKLHEWKVNNLNFDQTGRRKICLTNFFP